jgi:hypothetical protein
MVFYFVRRGESPHLSDLALIYSYQMARRARQHTLGPHQPFLEVFFPRRVWCKLYPVPQAWRDELCVLERRFPNFSAVIQHVRICCALGEHCGSGIVQLDNIPLAGMPGTDKTFFAEHPADFLGGGTDGSRVCQRMADQQSNSALAGSDAFWSNAKPSDLFDALVYGEYPNPTLIVDELDKVGSDNRL